jgi:hypothetical protein
MLRKKTELRLREIVGKDLWAETTTLLERYAAERLPRMWPAIVWYANTGEVEHFKVMVLTALRCMDEGDDWLETCGDTVDGEPLELLATRYHGAFTDLLRWHSNLELYAQLGPQALKFQMDQCAGIEMHREPHQHVSYIEWAEWIGSVMGPVCLFIKKQADLRDEHSVPQEVAFPYRVCASPGCGRFFLMTDPRQIYHSTACGIAFPYRVCASPGCGRFFLMTDPRQIYHSRACGIAFNASRRKLTPEQLKEKRDRRFCAGRLHS